MTAATSAPIGTTVSWRGNFPAADDRRFRSLLLAFLLLLRSLLAPRKLIVSAVAAGLLLAPLPAAFGHERLKMAEQSDRYALDVSEHGHSHDEDGGDDNAVGHSHNGHDPADHSHQFAFLGVAVNHGILPFPERWPALQNGAPDQAAGLGIDRPPKRMTSL